MIAQINISHKATRGLFKISEDETAGRRLKYYHIKSRGFG